MATLNRETAEEYATTYRNTALVDATDEVDHQLGIDLEFKRCFSRASDAAKLTDADIKELAMDAERRTRYSQAELYNAMKSRIRGRYRRRFVHELRTHLVPLLERLEKEEL